jgi:hypothetical protein
MNIKVDVDLNLKLTDDTKVFLRGLMASIGSVAPTAQQDPASNSGEHTGNGARTTTPERVEAPPQSVGTPTLRHSQETPIDPDARIVKPKKETKSKRGRPKKEDTPPQDTTAQEPTPETTTPPQDATPAHEQSGGLDDATFRKAVSDLYMGVSVEQRSQMAKLLQELLTKFEAPNIVQVSQDKRQEFLNTLKVVVDKLTES